MYDNSRQRSAVLPIVLGTVGSVLAAMVVRRIREDRAAARDAADVPPAPRGRGTGRSRDPGRMGRERHR
ncbi:hypothetical protein ACH9EU_14185 [Kocuria sp. M1R5S2]|uniref:hypothetical protein n=1 Tax=Kocuria rhizosphaerae TaxID=3376285 RepID=UPI0037B96A3E